MAGFVQEVGTAKTHQQHLQQGILNEHPGEDSRYRHHIIAKLQVTRLACEHAHKHVRQHG